MAVAMQDKSTGKMFQGNLELMVLSVLNNKPNYGYLIQQQLALVSEGMVNVQAGTLYPLLHRLEAEKLVRSKQERSTGRPRKYYSLTAAGRRRLKQRAQDWSEFARCLELFLSPMKKNRSIST